LLAGLVKKQIALRIGADILAWLRSEFIGVEAGVSSERD
jgi:hypothetical protein